MFNSLPVRIETLKISEGENKKVFHPRVVDLEDHGFENYINQVITQETQQMIDEQVGGMSTTVAEMIGLFEIKNNQRQVLSLILSNYTYHYQAAHGMTIIKGLTFDLEHNKVLQLKDLFKQDSDYVGTLSSLIHQQIKQRDILLINEFDKIKPDQGFYIADKTLVIYFQLYEITPYVFGFPFFPISVYDIESIIEEDGALGKMLINN